MFVYLPDGLRDDELLYSGLARSCRLQRVPASRDMLQAAFGSTTIVASIDLPSRLDIAASRLICLVGQDRPGEHLLGSHTLFPYYASVVDVHTAQRAKASMLGPRGGRVHGMLGVRASNVQAPAHLRYCHECVGADRLSRGTAWWRRAHQLAGAFVCVDHGVVLTSSRRLTSSSRERLAFHDLESSIADDDPPCIDVDLMRGRDDVFHQLAKGANGLLRAGQPHIGGLAELWDHRFRGLHASGFGRGRRIDIRRLRHALLDRFGCAFLQHQRCRPGGEAADDWVARMARPPRHSAHPLYHLLLAVLLDIDVLPALAAEPCGASSGPAPASSPLVVESPVISDNRDRRIVEAIGRHPRGSLIAIAREAGADVLTVKRVAWRSGLWRAGWVLSARVLPATKGADKRLSMLEGARRRWTELGLANPHMSRKELRNAAPAAHALLFRRDRAWLDANSPTAKRSGGRGRRVDWAARDAEASGAIEAVVPRLDRTINSRAVRPATIARAANVLSLVAQHRDRMPLVAAALEREVEHPSAKAHARLVAASDRRIEAGSAVPAASVLAREAGLNPRCSESLRVALEAARMQIGARA